MTGFCRLSILFAVDLVLRRFDQCNCARDFSARVTDWLADFFNDEIGELVAMIRERFSEFTEQIESFGGASCAPSSQRLAGKSNRALDLAWIGRFPFPTLVWPGGRAMNENRVSQNGRRSG